MINATKVDLLKVAASEGARDLEFGLDGASQGKERLFPDSFAASGNVMAVEVELVAPRDESSNGLVARPSESSSGKGSPRRTPLKS